MPIPAAALAIGGGLAGLGALGNWLGARDNAEMLSQAYDDIMARTDNVVGQNQSDIDAYKRMVSDTYGEGASKYNEALANFLNSPVYQNENFNYGGDINQFYDPYANQRVQAAMDAINASGANGGNRFSSDFISRVGAKQQAMASEEWEKAYQKLMQDRQMALQEYNTNSQNQWNNYNAQNSRNQAAVDAYGADREGMLQGLSDVTQATMNNRLGGLQTQAQTIMGKANANQGTSGWDLLGNLGSAGAAFLGNFYGKR